jgi:hypothetical protein
MTNMKNNFNVCRGYQKDCKSNKLATHLQQIKTFTITVQKIMFNFNFKIYLII